MDENKIVCRFIRIYEVIKIRQINLAVLTITAAAILVVLIMGEVKGAPSNRLSAVPSHSVISKWYGDNDRRQNIHTLQIDNGITLHAKTDEKADCIVLKTTNVSIKAYTKGKILYECEEKGRALTGTRITIIDTREVKKGAVIFLHLSPAKNKIGTIDAPIYSTSVNDYLLTLLSKEKCALIALIAMVLTFAISLSFFIFEAVFLKRKSPLPLLFCTANLLAIMLTISNSDLYQFVFSSSEMRSVFSAISYVFLPIVTAAFLFNIIRQKNTDCKSSP